MHFNIYSTSKLCVRKDNIKTKLDKDFANRRTEGSLTLKLPDQQNATFALLVITVIGKVEHQLNARRDQDQIGQTYIANDVKPDAKHGC